MKVKIKRVIKDHLPALGVENEIALSFEVASRGHLLVLRPGVLVLLLPLLLLLDSLLKGLRIAKMNIYIF